MSCAETDNTIINIQENTHMRLFHSFAFDLISNLINSAQFIAVLTINPTPVRAARVSQLQGKLLSPPLQELWACPVQSLTLRGHS